MRIKLTIYTCLYTVLCIYAAAYTHTNTIYTQLRIHMLYIILLLFSHSVTSNSLPPYTLQHARLPCPSPSPITQAHVHESVKPSNHLILCNPLLLHSIFQSIRVFSNGSVLLIRWLKYQSFSISPPNEYSKLIPFRIDWFDLLAVQGTLKNLLQHHTSKASILWCSAFFGAPTLTSILDHWKYHSFDQADLCWQSNISAF